MKSNRKKRILATILCMVMVLSSNISALAEGEIILDPNVGAEAEAPEAVTQQVTEETPPVEQTATIPETKPEEATPVVPETKPEETAPAVPETKPEETAPAVPETKPEETAPAVPETKPEEAAPAVPETKPEEAAPAVPETKPEEAAPAVPEIKPEETAPAVPETKPEEVVPAEPVVSEATELTTEFNDASGKFVQKVTAKLPAGAFEAETASISMEVSHVSASSEKHVKDLMTKALLEGNELGNYFLYKVEFKVNGETKTSLKPIEITFAKSDLEIQDIKKANVFYMEPADVAAGRTQDKLVEIPQRSELIENLQAAGKSTANIEEDYDLSSIEIKNDNRSGKIVLEGRQSTIYGCYVEKEPEKVVETPVETPVEAPAEIPVLSYEDEKVIVNVTADTADAIPAGATLKVVPITSENTETKAQYEEVGKKIQEKVAQEEKEVVGFLAYDITFVDAEGKEIEPSGKVKVSMDYKKAELPQEVIDKNAIDAEVALLHLEENAAGEVQQVVDMGVTQKAVVDTLTTTEGIKVQRVEAETESFSAFTIVWVERYQRKVDVTFMCYETEKTIDVDSSQYNVTLDGAKDIFEVSEIKEGGKYSKLYTITDRAGKQYVFHKLVNEWDKFGREKGTVISALRWKDDHVQWTSGSGDNRQWKSYDRRDKYYIVYSEAPKKPEKLTTVQTLDTSKLINMRMIDYSTAANGLSNSIGGRWDGPVHQGLVQKVLKNGYPVTQDGTELKSLFSGGKPVNNLFLKKNYDATGYYEYSSFENYAYLNADGNFTVYDQIGTPRRDNKAMFYRRGNFLPYTPLIEDDFAKYGNLYDENGNLLPSDKSRHNEALYYANALKDQSSGYYFGMYLEAKFAQLEGGKVNNNPMIYEFNGDDDLWVYIDDVLVLDIGGEHDAHSGYINFATGEVHVEIGNNQSQTITIKEMFRSAGKLPDGSNWNDRRAGEFFKNNTFKDYTAHNMKMFYMERGGGASNLHMKFNLEVIPDGQVRVRKQLATTTDPVKYGDVQFAFELYVENQETHVMEKVTSLDSYNAKKKTVDGAEVDLTMDNQGRFHLKPTETALINNIPVNLKYEVKEVDVQSDQFDKIEIGGTAIKQDYKDSESNIKYDLSSGEDTVGNRPMVTFINSCSAKNLRTLQVEKTMPEGQTSQDNFKILVELEGSDGQLHPYKGGYRVTGGNIGSEGVNKETTDGYIILKQNEVASIYNILSDTQFKVTEASLDETIYHSPTYQVSVDSTDMNSYKEGQEGIIQLYKDAKVIVTNSLVNPPSPPSVSPDEMDPVPHHKYIDHLGNGQNGQTSLTGEEFYRLYLDVKGIPNTIPESADIVLILDYSSSMKKAFSEKTRFDYVKESARLAVNTLIPDNNSQIKNRIGIVWFDRRADEAQYNQTFTADKQVLMENINSQRTDSGTNYQGAFWEAQKMIERGSQRDRKKFVIFVTDGSPYDYHIGTKENPGRTDSSGTKAKQRAVDAVRGFSGVVNGFYAVSVGSETGYNFLQDKILNAVNAPDKQILMANNKESLQNSFSTILGSITKQIGNVTITDTLSDYVKFVGEDGFELAQYDTNHDGIITGKNGDEIAQKIGLKVNISDYDANTYDAHSSIKNAQEYQGAYTYEINLNTKTIKVNFGKEYFLERDKVYTISFNVMLTEKATIEVMQEQNISGDPNTDYPDNITSSEKLGLYSNKEASLSYERVENGVVKTSKENYEKPVVQPYEKSDWQIKKVSKTSNLPLSGATFTLSKDNRVMYTGTSGENGIVVWKTTDGKTVVSKEIEKGVYTLKETVAPVGYALSTEQWIVEIKANGMKPVIKRADQPEGTDLLVNKIEGTNIYELQITNTAVYDLPSTGGPGIFAYMTSGTLLLMAAALLLYKMKRKEMLE